MACMSLADFVVRVLSWIVQGASTLGRKTLTAQGRLALSRSHLGRSGCGTPHARMETWVATPITLMSTAASVGSRLTWLVLAVRVFRRFRTTPRAALLRIRPRSHPLGIPPASMGIRVAMPMASTSLAVFAVRSHTFLAQTVTAPRNIATSRTRHAPIGCGTQLVRMVILVVRPTEFPHRAASVERSPMALAPPASLRWNLKSRMSGIASASR